MIITVRCKNFRYFEPGIKLIKIQNSLKNFHILDEIFHKYINLKIKDGSNNTGSLENIIIKYAEKKQFNELYRLDVALSFLRNKINKSHFRELTKRLFSQDNFEC